MIIHADLSSYLQLSAGTASSCETPVTTNDSLSQWRRGWDCSDQPTSNHFRSKAVFGRLKVFEPESENISTYLEQVHFYFEENGSKQTSVLLTVIGAKNYSIIRSLVAQRQGLCRVGDCFEGSFSAQTPAYCRTFPFLPALSGCR